MKDSSSNRILVVDDDAGQRDLFSSFLAGHGFEVSIASDGAQAIERLKSESISLMVSDIRMPGMNGFEALHRARQDFPELPVLLVTGYADIRDAVRAMQDGAVNYLEKPIDLDELLLSVQRALGMNEKDIPGTVVTWELPPGVIAESTAMHQVLNEAAIVAPTDSRVLISGESGTGKEVLAALLHAWSKRAARPFLHVNCASIPDNLLESELFGHERGAFTGAVGQRLGRFEEVDGGTILLDEIAEIPAAVQAKLLRVIQDGIFQRLGSNTDIHSDVRIIAATNRCLEDEVAKGKFREDLFYRLNVIELHLPPLRERPADILPLAELFSGRYPSAPTRLSNQLSVALTIYHWPGNVRELQNAMERASLMASGGVILPKHLPRRIQDAIGTIPSDASLTDGNKMEEMERLVILQTLRKKDFNRSETARALGISRRALIYKLQHYKQQGFTIDLLA